MQQESDRRGPRVSRLSICGSPKGALRESVSWRCERPAAGTAADVPIRRSATSGRPHFRHASARSLDSRADLRWGADGKGYRRIIAPNGICVLGRGRSPRTIPYSGYFKKGSKGLTIGRFSSDGNETNARAASLDQSRHEDLPDDGSRTPDAVDSGEPDRAGRSRRHAHRLHQRRRSPQRAERHTPIGAESTSSSCFAPAGCFSSSTRSATAVSSTRSPSSARLQVSRSTRPSTCCSRWRTGQRRIEGDGLDFRDEIYGHIFKPGDAEPTGSMEFDISVSDTGQAKRVPGTVDA